MRVRKVAAAAMFSGTVLLAAFALTRNARRTQLEAKSCVAPKLRRSLPCLNAAASWRCLPARLMPEVPPRVLTTSPALLPSGYLRSSRRWCSAPDPHGPIRRARPPDRLRSLAKILIAGGSIAVGAVTAAILGRRLRTPLPPPELRLTLRNRRRRPRCRATAAAARGVGLHRGGGIVDDETELRGVVVGLVARHEEVLRAGRLERDQEPCFFATHGQAMRDVLRERRIGPRFHLDLLVTDVRSDRALEDIEGLILARVGMDRRFLAREHPPFDDCPVAA